MTTVVHDIAVIGAGISGLAAARKFQESGRDVIVLEKSRGVGGRVATRRMAVGEHEVPVDHGAQYFTARDRRFQDQVARWQEAGICFPWSEEFPNWSDGRLAEAPSLWKETRFACRKGMNALGKHLAEGLSILRTHRISSVEREGEGWLIHGHGTEDEVHPAIRAHTLFVSAPPPQALTLIGGELSAEQREMVSHIEMAPCIALMARYPEETPSPAWPGIRVADPASPLSWIAWDSSRRKTGSPGRFAVLHASREFSSRWLAADAEELRVAGAEMLAAAAGIGGAWMGAPEEFVVHRWRYAHAGGTGVPGGFIRRDGTPGLYLIGDAYNGGRLESAWLSGTFAAEDLLLRERKSKN